jgi:hypothetical protein
MEYIEQQNQPETDRNYDDQEEEINRGFLMFIAEVS